MVKTYYFYYSKKLLYIHFYISYVNATYIIIYYYLFILLLLLVLIFLFFLLLLLRIYFITIPTNTVMHFATVIPISNLCPCYISYYCYYNIKYCTVVVTILNKVNNYYLCKYLLLLFYYSKNHYVHYSKNFLFLL